MATTSTAMPKKHTWHAFRLRCDRIDRKGERWLLLTFYALIILTVAIEVIRRFALNYSSVWGVELARYAFIYLVWIAAAAAVRDRAHIRIDVLVNLGGPRMQRLAWWLSDIATLVLAVWALWLSAGFLIVLGTLVVFTFDPCLGVTSDSFVPVEGPDKAELVARGESQV